MTQVSWPAAASSYYAHQHTLNLMFAATAGDNALNLYTGGLARHRHLVPGFGFHFRSETKLHWKKQCNEGGSDAAGILLSFLNKSLERHPRNVSTVHLLDPAIFWWTNLKLVSTFLLSSQEGLASAKRAAIIRNWVTESSTSQMNW